MSPTKTESETQQKTQEINEMKTADEKSTAVKEKDELPTAIIIRDVPKELFDDPEQKANFKSMFQQITSGDDPIRCDFLKSFQRVRIIFDKPEHATAAKLLVEHHSFNGAKMKAFFAKNIKMSKRVDQDEEGHLKLPPLEKQFLISPPTSPPVGWVQHAEMAPVVCDIDLMARLASLAVDDKDKYEVYEGDEQQRRPSIVVTPCNFEGGGRGLLGRMGASAEGRLGGRGDTSSHTNSDTNSETELPTPMKVIMPHTPRPPLQD